MLIHSVQRQRVAALADDFYARLLAKLAKIEILVLDDWGVGAPKDAKRYDLLEVLEDRYGRASTVVTSQLPRQVRRLDREPWPTRLWTTS